MLRLIAQHLEAVRTLEVSALIALCVVLGCYIDRLLTGPVAPDETEEEQ